MNPNLQVLAGPNRLAPAVCYVCFKRGVFLGVLKQHRYGEEIIARVDHRHLRLSATIRHV